MQFGPSPLTQEYRHQKNQSPCCVPPAQWGNRYAREPGEKECELFGDILPGQEEIFPEEPAQHEVHQDELDRAAIPIPSNDIVLMYRVQDVSMVSL